MFSSN